MPCNFCDSEVNVNNTTFHCCGSSKSHAEEPHVEFRGNSTMVMQTRLQDVPGLIVYENLKDTEFIHFGRNESGVCVFLTDPPAWMSRVDDEKKTLRKGDPVSDAGAPLGQRWFVDLTKTTLDRPQELKPVVLQLSTGGWLVLRTVAVYDPKLSKKGSPKVAFGILIVCPHHEMFNTQFSTFVGPQTQSMPELTSDKGSP
jgi:hypothetical protein